MLKQKTFSCLFLFIFAFFWPPYAHSMEDNFEKFRQRATNNSKSDKFDESSGHIFNDVPNEEIHSEVSTHLLDQNHDLLENLFKRTVTKVRVPDSVRQIVSGILSLLPLIPTGQVFVPTALIGLDSLGLTKNVIPSEGWESWALVAAVGIPIVLAATIATYNGASKFFKPTLPEDLKNQDKCFQRHLSKREAWSQSYFTQAAQLVFWGALFSAFLMNTESRVSGWGDYRIVGSIFSAFATIAIYFIIVRATSSPSKYTWRYYASEDEEKTKEACLAPISAVIEEVKHRGLTSETQILALQINAFTTSNIGAPLKTVIASDQRERGDPYLSEFKRFMDCFVAPLLAMTRFLEVPIVHLEDGEMPPHQNEDEESSIGHEQEKNPIPPQSSQSLVLDDLSKPNYLSVLERIKDISNESPSWLRKWSAGGSTFSKYASRITQILSIPAQELIAFSLSYVTLDYFNVSHSVTLGVSIGTAIIYTCVLPLISIRENSLIREEYEQICRLLKPRETCGYFGERIAPVIARCGTLLYFTFPLTNFIRNNLFDEVIGITNVPAQILILAPLMAGIGLAAPAQFLDYTFTILSNWVATGGPVNLPMPCCKSDNSDKLFCCFDRDNRRAAALELLSRLQEIESHVLRLNENLTKFLASQLGISLHSSEKAPLLEGEKSQ